MFLQLITSKQTCCEATVQQYVFHLQEGQSCNIPLSHHLEIEWTKYGSLLNPQAQVVSIKEVIQTNTSSLVRLQLTVVCFKQTAEQVVHSGNSCMPLLLLLLLLLDSRLIRAVRVKQKGGRE